MNIILENYLEMFQKVSMTLNERSSETAFAPIVGLYKFEFNMKVFSLIDMAKGQDLISFESSLEFARITNLFLEEKLDPEIQKFKVKNTLFYKAYFKSRKIIASIKTRPDFEGKANYGHCQIAHIPYLSARNFLFKNNGDCRIQFALSPTFKIRKETEIFLNPSESAMRSSGILNADGKANKIYVVNNNESIVGNYQIWIL